MESDPNSNPPSPVQNRENGEPNSEPQPEHVSISVTEVEADPEWVASMEERIKITPKLLDKSAGRSSCCIFRVPQSLVEINEKAYQPHIVSIGPFHHGKPHLTMIQEHKWRLLGALLTRTHSHGVSLSHLYRVVAPLESKIRECYSETVDFSSQELVEMMVLDGCFIIEVLCIVGRLVLTDLDDPIFNLAWIFSFLIRDLLRLENQIPYFVLEALFDATIAKSGIENLPTLPSLALELFNYMMERPAEVLSRFKNGKGNHLLDLFRQSFLPQDPLPDPSSITSSSSLQLIQSARKLHLAGIKFRPRRSDCFLDIRFSNGVLEIPTLTLDDFTSSVFLNFVAFEQCYNHCSKHITTYATFMGCLINTPVDAGYLCDRKVVENYFGTDEEIARFFNNLGKEVAFDIQRTYLARQFRDVNEYYRNNWHVRWAGFKHTYFDTPWSFISALAAVLLLILTMIQAFFSVYAYTTPAKPAP